jgi:peroxiredoxin
MVMGMAQHRKRFKAWQKKMDALAPKVGDMAPDFELRDAEDKDPVRLSDFRGKRPVALIFGSYT